MDARNAHSVGNGGWAGTISYAAMADALRAGYATASTDTGHVGGRGTFALDHPEKLIDFSWRSEHEMTVAAKTLIEAFYGAAPKRSYWNGCSTGGRQGLKEAQMFPNDFDGIIAGAPANRTAISRRLVVPRARSRFATFAQTIKRTRATAERSTRSAGRSGSTSVT